MSEGDRYRDYDPKERVVELEHEVAGLRRELEEAKNASTAHPDLRLEELKKKVDELQRALSERENDGVRVRVRDEPRLALARERERLVWQLVAQWMALAIDIVLGVFVVASQSVWALAFLLGALFLALLVFNSHRAVADVERRFAAMEGRKSASRLRVADDPQPGDRRRWEEQQDGERAIADDAREEKGWGESRRDR